MTHIGGNYQSYPDMPLTSESEKKIEEDSELALRYLDRRNNTDLAEMLGLEPKGEN